MAQLLSIVLAAVILAWPPAAATAQTSRPGIAVVVDIEGAIGPATTDHVRRGLAEARDREARLVVLRLDTPGGLDSAMRDIIRAILESPVPVAAYVAPNGARAASAGTYIVYAAHLAAMAPSTHLGAATPVQLGGGFGRRDDKDKDKDPKTGAPSNPSEAKAVNDAVAYIRGLAALRERNADWAEKAVREAATLTAPEALAQRVIEIVAADPAELLARADGRGVQIGGRTVALETRGLALVEIETSWRTRLLGAITNPNVAYMLLLIGFYGLLLEFFSPGATVPGVIGGISLLVALYALNLLPVSYAGAGLLLLGVALMVAEAFVPSFGVLGIGGVAAFAAGSLLLFDGTVPGFRLAWPVVAIATSLSAGFFVVVLAAAWRSHRRQPVTGEAALLGSAGKVVTWGNGEGEVQVHGERWHATSTVPLAPGQRVRILERRALTLHVEPCPESAPKP